MRHRQVVGGPSHHARARDHVRQIVAAPNVQLELPGNPAIGGHGCGQQATINPAALHTPRTVTSAIPASPQVWRPATSSFRRRSARRSAALMPP